MKLVSKRLGLGLIVLSILLLVLLSFVKLDLDSQSAALCELNSEAGVPMTDCPFHNNPSSWLMIIAFGIVFVILGTGGYLISYPKTFVNKKTEIKAIDISELGDDERKCYELVKEKGGSIFQSELVRKTRYSKVKVTRILDGLEQKDILERKRRGMTNIVILK